jgi:hypothetical protein
MKKCSKCGKEKDISLFSRKRGRPDGRDTICKDCNNAYARAWKKLHPKRYEYREKKLPITPELEITELKRFIHMDKEHWDFIYETAKKYGIKAIEWVEQELKIDIWEEMVKEDKIFQKKLKETQYESNVKMPQ